KRTSDSLVEGCDPELFAERIAEYLELAAAERALLDAGTGGGEATPTGSAAPAPVEAPVGTPAPAAPSVPAALSAEALASSVMDPLQPVIAAPGPVQTVTAQPAALIRLEPAEQLAVAEFVGISESAPIAESAAVEPPAAASFFGFFRPATS